MTRDDSDYLEAAVYLRDFDVGKRGGKNLLPVKHLRCDND